MYRGEDGTPRPIDRASDFPRKNRNTVDFNTVYAPRLLSYLHWLLVSLPHLAEPLGGFRNYVTEPTSLGIRILSLWGAVWRSDALLTFDAILPAREVGRHTSTSFKDKLDVSHLYPYLCRDTMFYRSLLPFDAIPLVKTTPLFPYWPAADQWSAEHGNLLPPSVPTLRGACHAPAPVKYMQVKGCFAAKRAISKALLEIYLCATKRYVEWRSGVFDAGVARSPKVWQVDYRALIGGMALRHLAGHGFADSMRKAFKWQAPKRNVDTSKAVRINVTNFSRRTQASCLHGQNLNLALATRVHMAEMLRILSSGEMMKHDQVKPSYRQYLLLVRSPAGLIRWANALHKHTHQTEYCKDAKTCHPITKRNDEVSGTRHCYLTDFHAVRIRISTYIPGAEVFAASCRFSSLSLSIPYLRVCLLASARVRTRVYEQTRRAITRRRGRDVSRHSGYSPFSQGNRRTNFIRSVKAGLRHQVRWRRRREVGGEGRRNGAAPPFFYTPLLDIRYQFHEVRKGALAMKSVLGASYDSSAFSGSRVYFRSLCGCWEMRELTRNTTAVFQQVSRAAVVERLDCAPPTKANRARSPAGSLLNFRNWEPCRTMPLVGGVSRGSPVSPLPLRSDAVPLSPRFTLIGSQYLVVKSRQNLSTQLESNMSLHRRNNLFKFRFLRPSLLTWPLSLVVYHVPALPAHSYELSALLYTVLSVKLLNVAEACFHIAPYVPAKIGAAGQQNVVTPFNNQHPRCQKFPAYFTEIFAEIQNAESLRISLRFGFSRTSNAESTRSFLRLHCNQKIFVTAAYKKRTKEFNGEIPCASEEIWAALNTDVFRADEGEESGIVRHDYHVRTSGAASPPHAQESSPVHLGGRRAVLPLNHRGPGEIPFREIYGRFIFEDQFVRLWPLVHTVFNTYWRTIVQPPPYTVTADNQCTFDIGIFVHKTVESSPQVIELANFLGLSQYENLPQHAVANRTRRRTRHANFAFVYVTYSVVFAEQNRTN
ncbi:hypothetical protein PR048_032239 [Dryococelus australis]|uniref:Uncharacterized protein n=1 Tax=Dryococelus australis TaxID=614101 RepID=A0ABQ9G4H8_9NEOP|nr:hypothetical protein PR048_032239 [Dryococelus australis]